ncbi:MAG: hypothetical protein HY360_16335 [Verrucomicrobia bacterium]|nr:hypothetical protein [Verrucomicrobiota bacterium]
MKPFFRLLCAATLILVPFVGLKGADAPAPPAPATGDSTITRSRVNLALHIPAAAAGEHGPLGVLIFFGGVGDSIEYYQKAFTPAADALDLVVVVPQMPWFAKRGEVEAKGVLQALDGVAASIESQFHSDPDLRLVGGASAGGPPAHDLAKKWGARVPFLLLHSTLDSAWVKGPRLLHLVGRNETAWLGTDAHGGQGFDVHEKDLYAVPDEDHQVHFKHMQPWLETELSAWRIAVSERTLRVVEEKLKQNQPREAGAILHSTKEAVRFLSATLDGNDPFFAFQNKRRKELREKYQKEIQAIETIRLRLKIVF